MDDINSATGNTPQRPVFLTVLCILTFISSGMGGLSALTTPLFADVMVDLVNASKLFDDALKPQIIGMLKAGWGYYMATFILAACSFTGAVLMWNLRKAGFHFYTLANLGLLFIPTLFLGVTAGIENVISSLLFIGMYAIYLKLMR
jgi:hypothetical protein